jgi:hypothetical protein
METLQPDTTYKPGHIEVNRSELFSLLSDLDEHIANGMRIYARLENLIKQGNTPNGNQ